MYRAPKGVNIPSVFELYNDGAMYGGYETVRSAISAASILATRPITACSAGPAKKCPQHIPIIQRLKGAHAAMTNGIT